MARVALVTGADSGIGRASATALASAGFDVGITWHTDRAGAAGTAREVTGAGQRAHVAQLDLTDLPAAPGVVDELAGALGGVDVPEGVEAELRRLQQPAGAPAATPAPAGRGGAGRE